jgi:hypothetical protein
LLYVATVHTKSKNPELTDFYKFYKSAELFLKGKDIYSRIQFTPSFEYSQKLTEKGRASLNALHPNLNSPLHILSISPFAAIPFRMAFWSWSFLSLIIVFAVAGSIPVSLSSAKSAVYKRIGLLILLLGYFPIWVNFLLGQYGLVLLGLIFYLWLASRQGKQRTAGLILGVAMSLKIFLGLFLVFYAVRKQWRIIVWCVGIFAILNILGFIIFGFSAYKQHISLLSNSALYINASWNASLAGFFSRIFGGAENIPLINMPIITSGIVCSFSLLLILALIWISRPLSNEASRDRFDLGFSLVIVSMLLISPFGWIYYFPILIIPLVICWRVCSKLPSRKIFYGVIAVAWITSSIPTSLINSEEVAMDNPMVWFVDAGFYFYSLVVFCFIILTINYRAYSKKNIAQTIAS